VVMVELIVGGESSAVVDPVGMECHRERAGNDQDGVPRSTTNVRRATQTPLTLTLSAATSE